jgi:hypothetical protein
MNTFSRDQERIDIEANAMRILGMLRQFQSKSQCCQEDSTRAALDRAIREGLLWTAEMISVQMPDMYTDTVLTALSVLLKRGYVQRGKNEQWFITFEGRKAYEDEMNSRLMTGACEARFKSEALSGLTESGDKSELTWAALPSMCEAWRENRVEQETVEQCTRVERVRRICDRYQIPVDAALEKLKTGEVRVCWKCMDDIALFHRHNGKNGKQWQSYCVECRRKQKRIKNG